MRRSSVLLLLVSLGALPACFGGTTGAPGSTLHVKLQQIAQSHDALAIADALEELVAEGTDTEADRRFAYEQVRAYAVDTAAYAYARAVVTGRVVQSKGLLGADMLGEVEHFARRSRELDPNFRDGAATRMLGTLYVIAPTALLKNGDSEVGLELLEGLVEKRPDVLENHLRVAEAYLALGDADPAKPHLCLCKKGRARLRGDEQKLLSQLLKDAGDPTCEEASAPAASP